MRYIWTIMSALFLMTVLGACQALGVSTPAPQRPAAQPGDPGSIPESNGSQTLTPTLPQEDTAMPPTALPDEAAGKMISLVKQHLAQKLGIPPEQVVVSDFKSVTWRDASLGCPKPGVDYIQVETPGYNILLDVGGTTYRFHTDAGKRFVQCNK